MLFSKLLGKYRTPIQYRDSRQRIGDYTLVREIGSGATSNVYLGLHVSTLRAAAIKQLSLKCSAPAHKQMFAMEASLCGALEHPNVVDLYGANLDDPGGAYLVMEYVDGTSLDKHENPGTLLPLEQVLDIIRQAAEALRYASSVGIIHRDVKPANIILRKDGRVKMADFGCAVADTLNTAPLAIAGSLPFMAPEQIVGQALSHRSDIYSLGVVFYRLLTGHYPFAMDEDATAQAYATRILHTPYTPIESHRRDVPQGLAAVIDRALRKKPADRFETWDEFMENLHRASMNSYGTDEQLSAHWQSFELHLRKRSTPHNYDLSFGF